MSLSGPCLIVLEDPLVSLCRGWACRMVDDYLEPSKGGAGRTRCWRPRREAARHVGSACACCPTLPRLARADLAEPNERPGPALPLMATASRTGTPDRIRTGATALRGRRARPLHNGGKHVNTRGVTLSKPLGRNKSRPGPGLSLGY
jgi:hypothetical protein